MIKILTLISAPTQAIVSKAEMKSYLKIGSDTTDDDLIEALIDTATLAIENEAGGVALYEQTWEQKLTGGVETIELLKSPIIGVPTVSYYEDFSTVTASNITYSSHFRNVDNVLHHVDGFFEKGREGDGYVVRFVCGLFTASNITGSSDIRLDTFKTAIMRTVAWLYEQREEHATKIGEGNWSITYENDKLPMGIKRLVMPMHSGRGLI